MKKEFVPYEPALALKELGFDEPCFGKYLSNLQSDWKKFELILEMGMNEEFEDEDEPFIEKLKITVIQIFGIIVGITIMVLLNLYEDEIEI